MNEALLRQIYDDLYIEGKYVSPRGLKVLEIENYNYELPPYCRFVNFKCRNLNIEYIKREFLWYLKGDKTDTSIAEYAQIWKSLITDKGTINSNYGRYIFSEINQFDNVVKLLTADKDTRKAMIVILSESHLKSDDLDTPCTISIGFRIRENRLNMTVRMRSQDAILGMSNDLPAFSFIHEMMYLMMKDVYPELEYGDYYHSADSFHIYEKHWPILNQILKGDEYINYECPKMSSKSEVDFLRKLDFTNIPEEYLFSKWLVS